MHTPPKKSNTLNIFLLFLLGTGLIGGFITVNMHLNNLAIHKHEQAFNNRQHIETTLSASAIGEAFDAFLAEAALLADYSIAEYVQGKRPRASLQTLLDALQSVRGDQTVFIFLTEAGKPDIISRSDSTGKIAALDLARKWSTAYWNATELAEGRMVVPPVFAAPGSQYIGFLMPVRADDAMKGLLVAAVNLRPLIDKYIVPMRSSGFGAGFVLTANGTVVYDHEEEIIGRNVFDGLHADFPDVLELDRRLLNEDSGEAEYSFTVKRGREKSRKLIAWSTLHVGSRKLVVCLASPDYEIDSSLRETRILQTIANILIILLGSAFAYLLFRRETARRLHINEERLEAALAGNRDGVWDWHVLTGEEFFSRRWKEILGFPEDDPISGNREWRDRVHPEDAPRVTALLKTHLEGATPYYEAEYRIRCRDDSYKWILSRGKSVTQTRDGRVSRMIGTISDISERKKTEIKIRLLSQAVENGPSAVLITDPEGNIQYVNKSFTRVFGYTLDEVAGKSAGLLKSDKQDPLAFDDMWAALYQGRSWSGELINKGKDGNELWLRVGISPIMDDQGNIVHFVGTQEDITALKRKEEELARLATTDELTGINNRRNFMELAKREYRRSLRHGTPLSIVIFDIDHFKAVNDTYGHEAGDMVLKGLTKVVSENIREIDMFGRVGGEEFGLILPRADTALAVTASERIRKAVEEATFDIDGLTVEVTVSFGVAGYPPESPRDMADILREADKALYHAKQNGRNRVSAYIPGQDDDPPAK